MNKSEIFKKAWSYRKQADMRLSMSAALKRAWRMAKEAANMNINDIKDKFWSAWKRVKSFRSVANYDFFRDVCDDLANFAESEIRATFGKYGDFVVSKVF